MELWLPPWRRSVRVCLLSVSLNTSLSLSLSGSFAGVRGLMRKKTGTISVFLCPFPSSYAWNSSELTRISLRPAIKTVYVVCGIYLRTRYSFFQRKILLYSAEANESTRREQEKNDPSSFEALVFFVKIELEESTNLLLFHLLYSLTQRDITDPQHICRILSLA